MTSIRRFLLAVLVSTISLVMFYAALHGYRSGMQKAQQLFDEQLAEVAELISSANFISNPEQSEPHIHSERISFQIWSGTTLLHRSANAPDQQIAAPDHGYGYANFHGYRWRCYTLYDSRHERRIVTAYRTDMIYLLAEEVIVESILPIVLALPFLALAIWLVVSRGLKPLLQLANKLHNKPDNDLSPLQLPGMPEELQPVVASVNELLARLTSAFEREKRFSADAAHELRTPITAMKIHLHNLTSEMGPQTPGLLPLQESLERMAHVVEQILALYRTAPEQFMARLVPLDLESLVREVIAEEYPRIELRDQLVTLEGERCIVRGDHFALSLLFKNLLDNASRYSPRDASILVSLKQDQRCVVLTVEDSGPGIPQSERRRVFDRFYRGSLSVPAESGSGLGLTIVSHIAQLHHATIHLEDSHFDSGLAVIVKLPALNLNRPEQEVAA